MKWIVFIALNIFIFASTKSTTCDRGVFVKGENWIESYGKIVQNKNRYFLNAYGSWSSKTEKIEVTNAEKILGKFKSKEMYAYFSAMNSSSKSIFKLADDYDEFPVCSGQVLLVFKTKKELDNHLKKYAKPTFIFKK